MKRGFISFKGGFKMDYKQIWEQVLEQMKQKISKPSFETWLKSTEAIDFNDDILTITTPNEFARDWVDTRYSELMKQTINEITKENISIKVVSKEGDSTYNYGISDNKVNRYDTTDFMDLLLKVEERINVRFNELSERLDRLESKLEEHTKVE